MKFCIVSTQYLPTIGGVERYTASLARTLQGMGHGVTIVTTQLPGQTLTQRSADGSLVLRVPSWRLMDGRFPVAKPATAADILRQALDDADFCVIQTRFYPLSILASRICRKKKLPAIVVEHGSAPLMPDRLLGVLGSIYEQITCRYVHRQCPDFYGVSPSCCKWLQHFGIHTKKLLFNAVDIDTLNETAASGTSALTKLFTQLQFNPRDKTIVVFSGRFIPEKGVMPLVEAFQKIAQTYPDAVLLMSGDGPLRNTVQELNHSSILALGPLDYSVNAALLQYADMFILPSRSEGFATTVLEAAALHTVILTTPTGGSPLLIPDQEHGYLFTDMSPQTIYDALDYALARPTWRLQAAELTFQTVRKTFTWQKVAEDLLHIAQEKTT